MRYVLDTTALFNAKDLPINFDIITTQGVVDELRTWGLGDRTDMLLDARLSIHAPSERSMEAVREQAERTGDLYRLSLTDREVIALALDLGAPVISDDYSVQNVCSLLGIRCFPMEEQGIRKIYYWKFQCRGCGREYKRKPDNCPVCGGKLKPIRCRSEPPPSAQSK